MTVEEHYARMEKIFGKLPNPYHEPKQFAYFVKLYKYYHFSKDGKNHWVA